MVRDKDMRNSAVVPHSCNILCLSPLTFHSSAVGDAVSLREGCQIAERREGTFRNGVVFSSRPVKIHEKVHLRVNEDVLRWHGALRVGFTNVPPSARSLPLPCLAIPNLTEQPGHWAVPVNEDYCQVGSELKFWVSRGGSIYVQTSSNMKCKVLEGVDLSQPLWAMIDIYGQTSSIFLLGSERKVWGVTKRSCPAPARQRLTSSDVESLNSSMSDLSNFSFDMSNPADTLCVVCIGEEASKILPCGHRCLCKSCFPRIRDQFGTCPLCRHLICTPSVEGRHVPNP
ncbi:hypothetical protein INR49_006025 [Caranx melampygus]|nr:hypothetical protein INR49_006025 [Caranx melampygus]